MMSGDLPAKIADLVQFSSSETIQHILRILHEAKHIDEEKVTVHVLGLIRQPKVRKTLEQVFCIWYGIEKENHDINELISIVSAAHEIKLRTAQKNDIDLVWTGPQSSDSNMRRIDEALIEIISLAQEEIIVVSFAVYKAIHIMNAINNALDRGVSTSLYLETAQSSGGKISFDTVAALDDRIRTRSKIYIWPSANRPMSSNGLYGSLHAKITCVDRKHLFISSANITGHAMELNMELGVLIDNSLMGEKVFKHFRSLVNRNIFSLYQ